MSNPANPYAAPDAPLADGPESPILGVVITPDELDEARRRLDEHLANPKSVADDARLAGGAITTRTWVMAGITAALLTAGAGLLLSSGGKSSDSATVFAYVSFGFGVVWALITLAMVIADRKVIPRSKAFSPDTTLRSWLWAVKGGRGGYLCASLAPGGRGGTVTVPRIEPTVTARGVHRPGSPKDLALWTKGFARAGTGQVRWWKVLSSSVVHQEGDLAVVTARVKVTSWPQWANIVSIVLFLLIRLLGIVVALVLYYTKRRIGVLEISKVLLRGRDGRWYLLSANLAASESLN